MIISVWFAALLILSTVDYRIDVGPLSIAVVEPVAIVGALLILGQKLRKREPITWRHPLFVAFAVITLWALIIRPFAIDWKHGLSDIRDWMVPTLTLLALLNVDALRPRRWVSIFAVVVLLLSGFGILQHYADGLRPFTNDNADYKTVIIPNTEGVLERASYAVGFFSSANGFGLFLTVGIPVVLAWLQGVGHAYGRKRYLLLLGPLLALYFTYSRFSILVVTLIGTALALHYLVRSTRRFTQIAATGAVLLVSTVTIAINVLPYAILRTWWWRVALWDIGNVTFMQSPTIGLLGNGMDPFAAMSFHFQPHNLYLYMFLEYGIVGLLFTLGLALWLVWQGLRWRAEGAFERQPMLAPLWLALLGQFFIGFMETTWLTLNVRELFVLTAVLFVGLAPAVAALPFPTRRVIVAPKAVQSSPYVS